MGRPTVLNPDHWPKGLKAIYVFMPEDRYCRNTTPTPIASMNNENLSPAAAQRLMKEIRSLVKKPTDGIKLYFSPDNMTNIQADIEGPEDTPFEGGTFRCRLVLGPDFPNSPPKGYFTTKMFHPNVAQDGAICVNTLKKDWKPEHGIRHVLVVIRCLLIYPNPASALNEDAGKMLLETYDDYFKRAALWTKIHASPKQEKGEDEESKGVQDNVPSESEDGLVKKKKRVMIADPKVAGGGAPKKKKKKADAAPANKKKKNLRRL